MTITLAGRRLSLDLIEPPRAAVSIPAAEGASDAELARLTLAPPADRERARWEAMLLMHGPHRL